MPPATDKKRILVADDEPDVSEGLAALLEGNGYQVTLAVNGLDAVKKAKAEKPDLILMDLTMPELDGFEACKLIRQDDATKLIPVLILTAIQMTEGSLEESFKARANAYINKPYQNDHLLKKIKEFISGEIRLPNY